MLDGMTEQIERERDANQGRAVRVDARGVKLPAPLSVCEPLPSLRLAASLPVAATAVDHVSRDPFRPHGMSPHAIAGQTVRK